MKGRHLGEFEEFLLLTIQASGEEAYGAALQQRLERETRRSISLGAVYAALDRLADKGCVQSVVAAGTPVRGGRSRRVFALTAQGRRAVAGLRRVRARLYRAANLPARGDA